MSLTEVRISEEVWLTCVTHALSTETEEIMGLLLGDIEFSDKGPVTALVWGAAPQTRSDRQKDRVETNPEQLAAATAQAERISASTGKTTRVIGWYHSHPHITVFPSHVDVRTQGMYQLLDPGFVGLIFSCFSEDGTKMGRIQSMAFQASDGRRRSTVNPRVQVVPTSYGKLVQDASSKTEQHLYSATLSPIKTSDNRELQIFNSTALQKGGSGGLSKTAELKHLFDSADMEMATSKVNASDQSVRLNGESSDMIPEMQEALHRSNLDLSGAEFARKEVPLLIVPVNELECLKFPLAPMVDLQRMIFDEERAAYHQVMIQSLRDGKIHPLAAIHHSGTYQASLCKLMEHCLSPVLCSLWDRLQQNEARLAILQAEAIDLSRRVLEQQTRTSSSSGSSPARHSHGRHMPINEAGSPSDTQSLSRRTRAAASKSTDNYNQASSGKGYNQNYNVSAR